MSAISIRLIRSVSGEEFPHPPSVIRHFFRKFPGCVPSFRYEVRGLKGWVWELGKEKDEGRVEFLD
jgi:hypothetical protein